MDCTTANEFDSKLIDFCFKTECSVWIDISEIFSDQQVKWKTKLIEKLKEFIDCNLFHPTRDISFNSDFTKFKVINIEPPKLLEIKCHKKWETEVEI